MTRPAAFSRLILAALAIGCLAAAGAPQRYVIPGCAEKYLRVGDSGQGTVTFPVSTPGDMTRLRFGGHYREPAGGLRPVRVTYVWDENGTEKRDVHIARGPRDTWDLTCATKPTMKSIVLDLVE